ncbi:hypothetical protein CFP56_024285 [Quercus suber]|uniref:Uncharacterized protein n=1 Tax=Quercus suber TaxID=58331 RepID=A0AAW0MGF5_QUESU
MKLYSPSMYTRNGMRPSVTNLIHFFLFVELGFWNIIAELCTTREGRIDKDRLYLVGCRDIILDVDFLGVLTIGVYWISSGSVSILDLHEFLFVQEDRVKIGFDS